MFSGIQAVIIDCDRVLVNGEDMSCHALKIVFQNEFGMRARVYKYVTPLLLSRCTVVIHLG